MEENNNQNGPNYENESDEKIKQAGKDLARKVGKVAKTVLKLLLKLIPPFVWLIIVIVILVVVLLTAFWYAITGNTYTSISNIAKVTTTDNSGNIRNITSIDENSRQIVIDTETFIKQIDKWFKDNHIRPELLGLKNGDYESLITFLQAEVVSSFPDLRERQKIGTPVGENELQGIVQFKRKFEDGTEQLLEYKPYTAFRKEVAKLGKKLDDEETQEQIYFTKEEVESAYNNLKTYFTIDNNYNVIIISLASNENTVQYSDYAKEEGKEDENSYEYYISVTKGNYQSIIQQYTMPFEFPLALLMVTNNPSFCTEVAKLAMPSREGEDSTGNNFAPKIVIDIQDSLASTHIREEYSYKANFKLQDYITYDKVTMSQLGGVEEETEQYTPYPIEVEKTEEVTNYKVTDNWVKTITSQLCISEALTWISDYTSTYTKIQKDDTNETNSEEDENDNDNEEDDKEDNDKYVEVLDQHSYLANQEFEYELPEDSEDYKIMNVEEEKKILEKDTDKKTKIKTSNTTIQYNKASSNIEEKWERFLSLLKIDSDIGIYNINDINQNDTYIKYKAMNSSNMVSPENNLLSAEAVLYQLLEGNTKTVMIGQIMKDMIAIYTGKIKPEESTFDFYIYEPGAFFTPGIGGTSGINGIQGQIYDFLLSKGMSSIGAAAILGNMQQESSFNTSASNGTHFGLCQWGGNRWEKLKSFSSNTSWVDLNTQLEFLWYELETTYSNVKQQLMNATDLQPAVDYFCRHYEICGDYEVEVQRRYRYALNWYQQWEVSHSNYGNDKLDADKVNRMITWATAQLGKSKFYSKYRGGYFQSAGYCAAFVKNAYYEAGLDWIGGNAIDVPHPYQIPYDEAGKINCDLLPVGACIVSSGTSSYGHVALYIGNGYVIEAGGSTVVKNKIDSSYGRGKFLGWGYAIKE